MGILLFGRLDGACPALFWQDDVLQYRCYAITEPHALLKRRLPPGWHWAVPALARLLIRGVQRWVAAGIGCDCDVDVIK